MWTSHSPGSKYAPSRSITFASPAAGCRPPFSISEMRPFSTTTTARSGGARLTQSISVALVKIVRMALRSFCSLGIDSRDLRHLQPALREGNSASHADITVIQRFRNCVDSILFLNVRYFAAGEVFVQFIEEDLHATYSVAGMVSVSLGLPDQCASANLSHQACPHDRSFSGWRSH